MKGTKILVIGIFICILSVFGVMGYIIVNSQPIKEEPVVSYMLASYAINMDSKEEVVTSADFAFVAKIINKVKTEYKNPVTIEADDGGTKTVAFPYTIYSIEVIDNIKGNLKKNITFNITKRGGITEDGKYLEIYEDDQLPEENKYYIMIGFAQPDGSILVSGKNSNILINVTNEEDIASSEEYKEYKSVSTTAIESNRERTKTSFEE